MRAVYTVKNRASAIMLLTQPWASHTTLVYFVPTHKSVTHWSILLSNCEPLDLLLNFIVRNACLCLHGQIGSEAITEHFSA